VNDIFFGGAAGGGKSHALLGHFLRHYSEEGGAAKGIFFRKEMPQLEDIIQEAQEIYPHTGARWLERKSKFEWPDGAELRFRALERDADYNKYIGHAYSWMAFDELPTWADPAPIDKMRSRLRSSQAKSKWFLSTGNPGGPGHGWVKARYIDPSPPMTPFLAPELLKRDVEHRRIFIPSKVQDNKILLDNDPEYVDRLKMVGSDDLVRAWLEGDWEVSLGQFFPEWNPDHHVVSDVELPEHWMRFRALDWGSKTPFCVLWLAVSDGSEVGGRRFPPGALIVYREWYGSKGIINGNQGLEMTSEEVGAGIASREVEHVDAGVADYQIFRCDNGPSIAEGFKKFGIYWLPADKHREPGWQQIRIRFKGEHYGTDEFTPMLYVMESCKNTIRTLPLIQHDTNHPEDAYKGGEDHAADALRYGCMYRPWTRYAKKLVRKKEFTLKNWIDMGRGDKDRLEAY
jgi:hypothetical protein